MARTGTTRTRGRPTTGIGKAIGLRLYPDLEQRIDAWIATHPDPKPSRPEAIRLLLEFALTASAEMARGQSGEVLELGEHAAKN